ncbi:tetratricopeptide repeat protein [Cellulosimicrobium sp. XJ-DQ-B-000]|uniref:tetratricopeptide repeat protein n=1 Tax=Cellulosimicrobium sp. XJ-DQ-B-000 TaxID=3072182 RepID=UPI00280A0F3D|nr:tetratricopeptide repeat protein [Cellulosimicrobium sp. XJ-DQ-B-000]MDQ8041764.1 tetratricopeptide repeat protein [Cellulosimicrobium sp. XJ-DQ-B-000]
MTTTVDPRAVGARVEMLVQMGRPERALDEVDEALAAVPDDPRLLLAAAWVRLHLQRSADALPLLEQVVAAQPAADGALYLLSVARQNTGDVPGARDAARRALELDPDDARYHLQLADALLSGRVRGADRRLARERIASALELAPEAPDRLAQAARLWSRLGDDDRARALVRQGLAVAPEHEDLLYLDAALALDASRSAQGYSGVLAMNPEHAEAGYLLHLSVWQQVLRLVEMPVLLVGAVALVVAFAMSDAHVGSVPVWGVVVLLWTGVTALRVLPVLLQVPRGLLRRTPFRGGTVVAIAVGWAGVLAGLALLYVVRDAVAVRWFLVGLGVVLALTTVTSAVLHAAMFTQARELGYLPAGTAGAVRIAALRASLRGAVVRRAVVLGIVAVVVGSIGPGAVAREDARPVAALAAVAYVLPLVVGMWAAWRVAARQRAVSDERPPVSTAAAVRAGLGGAVLVLATVLLLLAEAAALAALPVAPDEHDADGRYVQEERAPRDPGSAVQECTGRPATRLACLQENNRARQEELQERLGELDVPTIDVPTFDVPDLPDLQAPGSTEQHTP